jgi:hypothetical protein
VKVNGSGMVLDSGIPSTLFEISCPDNTTGIKLDGGLSSIELNGAGTCVINSGVSISSSGELLVNSTVESTSSSNASSIKTLGGISVAKTISCGTSLNLDFNQPYVVSGESSGALNFQSKVSSTNSNMKFFTNDGDATDNNTLSIYSKGTPLSQTNTEFLNTGFVVGQGFAIKTGRTGTGLSTPLTLQSNENTGQLKLETNGSVSTTGNLIVGTDLSVGGNVLVSGNLDTGITSPSLTINNATTTTTQVRSSLARNGITRTLVANFTTTPSSQGTAHVFDVLLPELSTNLVNSYDITGFASGYTAAFVGVENAFVRGITGGTSVRISFTSASTTLTVIQLTVKYTV